ncbi:hypothetical protein OG338_21415 [Streptomyces sp. NBC_00726]|uniref:hypothetical protein n=1 Tax=Streptomyces sp. NBC_00726 TaxID=2903674 RepID=UPI00386A1875
MTPLPAAVAPHAPATATEFTQRFSSTPRGARLARRLTLHQLDARGERRPSTGDVPDPAPLAEDGRGLLLVSALADRWEVLDRVPLGKTVVAELEPAG